MTFEDELKSKGFTDADLADPTMKGVLDKFRPAYEAAASERDRYKNDFETYKTQVETEWTPEINRRLEDEQKKTIQASLEVARLQEENRLAREYGLLPEAPKPAAPAAPAQPNLAGQPFDAKAHKLVTYDDVTAFARQEAKAIAQSYDLGEKYRYLTGKELREYMSPTGGRGLTGLLEEAQAARSNNIMDFAATKFNFAALEQAKADAATKAREDAIRAETEQRVRSEMAQQYGNPNLRTPAPSRASIIPRPSAAQGAQPWEKTRDELKTERLNRAVQNEFKAPVRVQ